MFATKLSDLDDFITPSQECVKMILPSSTGTGTITTAKVTIDQDMVMHNITYFSRIKTGNLNLTQEMISGRT